MALEKPGKLGEFFSPTLWSPCPMLPYLGALYAAGSTTIRIVKLKKCVAAFIVHICRCIARRASIFSSVYKEECFVPLD